MTLATPTVLAKDTRFANGSDSSGVVIGIGSVVLANVGVMEKTAIQPIRRLCNNFFSYNSLQIYYNVKCAFDTITIS